jgi:peptidoglycan/LPS O-acetylase OafA/YrhL
MLDGWRGISILSVLACHLLPLGPKPWGLNETAGPLGMVLFFNLSGFLIISTLLDRPDVRGFFIRRGCRILPLAVLFMLVALTLSGRSVAEYVPYLFFYVNYQPSLLMPVTSPLWSLCVEVQFYLFIGLLIAATGRRGLLILPVIGLLVTTTRIYQGAHVSIFTHQRVDEILAGATLALAYRDARLTRFIAWIGRIPLVALFLLLLVCCHPALGPMNYLRPYVGAVVIGHTLWHRGRIATLLEAQPLRYFADVSYAVYVIHPIMRVGWLGSGGTIEKYFLKRPVGFAVTFILAHLSTFYYEKWWIAFGKRLVSRRREPSGLVAEPAAAV